MAAYSALIKGADLVMVVDAHTEHSSMTLNDLVGSVRPTGTFGVVGVFVPQDPGACDEVSKHKVVLHP
jgi:hypothetical protein